MDRLNQSSTGTSDMEPPSPPLTGVRTIPGNIEVEEIDQQRPSATVSDLGAICNIADTASGTTHSSRYADMGLNRTRSRSPRPNPNTRSRKAAGSKNVEPVRMEGTHDIVQDEKDLTELEDLMIPKETRSSSRQRTATSASVWNPINKPKTPRYTTGLLTKSGSQPINNPVLDNTLSEETLMGDNSAVQQDGVPDEVNSVISLSSDQVDSEESEGKVDDVDDSTRWLDDKYFNHYGYLNYVNNLEDSESGDVAASTLRGNKTVVHTKPKAMTKKGLQVVSGDSLTKSAAPGKPLARRKQAAKTPTKAPAAKDKFTNDASHAVRETLDVDDEAKRDASTESSSDETGKWKLLEGNIDAPRTGNISVHKLTIKLRHTVTGESKTLTCTDVKHEDIDWTSRAQITAITQWRTDVFQNHGINTKKNMVMYTPLEDAWMTLFHRKLRATIEAGHAVRLPGPVSVMEVFNAFFQGKVLKDVNGDDVGTRTARDVISIRGKLDGRVSTIAKERRLMRGLVDGQNGGLLYIPVVTEEELEEFLEDGTVVVDDPTMAGKNAALDAEGKRSGRSSPKRKRDEKDAGQKVAKKPKKANSGT